MRRADHEIAFDEFELIRLAADPSSACRSFYLIVVDV
jgi:hypothetical protein